MSLSIVQFVVPLVDDINEYPTFGNIRWLAESTLLLPEVAESFYRAMSLTYSTLVFRRYSYKKGNSVSARSQPRLHACHYYEQHAYLDTMDSADVEAAGRHPTLNQL